MTGPQLWHPFTQQRGFQPLGTVVGARGAWLDLSDGRRVLDGISSWWVTLHGHAHPTLAAAIAAQAAAFDQVILADFDHGPALTLTRDLADHLPGGLRRVFFSDDGSTSVEVALKMAWQAQRARDPGRDLFVTLDGAYHGDTLGAMNVGARDTFTERFRGMLTDVISLPWDDADACEAWLSAHGDRVVAVIAEPMLQCAAGMRMCQPAFLARLAAAARAAGALFIADEVAVGFGRTGRMWGCDHAGVVPDLMCLSKGLTGGTLPLGVTVASDALYDGFLGASKREAFLHGHSYTGNPIACAAAVASLGLFRAEGTVGRFQAMTERWAAHAPAFAALPRARDVRWLGGVFALTLDGGVGYHDPIGGKVQRAALASGLYVRPLGDVVYLMPPACVTPDELDEALDRLRAAILAAVASK
jgi:adenosylmethionine-8-amino-7-oxononanoate aminotransferase